MEFALSLYLLNARERPEPTRSDLVPLQRTEQEELASWDCWHHTEEGVIRARLHARVAGLLAVVRSP